MQYGGEYHYPNYFKTFQKEKKQKLPMSKKKEKMLLQILWILGSHKEELLTTQC